MVAESIEFVTTMFLVANKLKVNIIGKFFCDENCVWSQKVSFCDELNFGYRKTRHLATRLPMVVKSDIL